MPSSGTQKMKATALTHQLSLQLSAIPADAVVEISERSDFNNQLYFDLSVPALGLTERDMRLWRCLLIGSDYFCIVSHPRSFDDDQPVTALSVLKVIDQNHLALISAEQLNAIELECANAVKLWTTVKASDVSDILGDFPVGEA